MIQAFTTLRKLLVPGGSGHLLPGAGALRTLLAVPVALCLLSACHGGSGPAPAMSGQESTDSVKTMMEQVDHFTRAGMYDKAFEKLTRAENLARNSGNQEALANVYNRFLFSAIILRSIRAPWIISPVLPRLPKSRATVWRITACSIIRQSHIWPCVIMTRPCSVSTAPRLSRPAILMRSR